MGKIGKNLRAARVIQAGFGVAFIGMVLVIAVIPRGDWAGTSVPLLIGGVGLGLLVSQLNNYILGPIEEERVSEAAGVNSAGQSFGLSFGLALAGGILLATLSFSFTQMTKDSTVIPPDQQELIANALEDNAELVSTTQLELLLEDEPEDISDEIVRINGEAGDVALQVAMLVGAGLPARVPELVPHAAPAGLQAVRGGRRSTGRLNRPTDRRSQSWATCRPAPWPA